MSTRPQPQVCTWECPWKGTQMCAQCLLNSQTLADGRVTLGVLCGIKSMYTPHQLPPCIVGQAVKWTAPTLKAA